MFEEPSVTSLLTVGDVTTRICKL